MLFMRTRIARRVQIYPGSNAATPSRGASARAAKSTALTARRKEIKRAKSSQRPAAAVDIALIGAEAVTRRRKLTDLRIKR